MSICICTEPQYSSLVEKIDCKCANNTNCYWKNSKHNTRNPSNGNHWRKPCDPGPSSHPLKKISSQ
uniref:Uncharacterized protein n=1 Tax=Arundo donax TaxID=35708 RepID=A0A0A9EGT0_ARUDO